MNGAFHDLVDAWACEPPASIRCEAEQVRSWVQGQVCHEIDCARYGVRVELFGSVRHRTHTTTSSNYEAASALLVRNAKRLGRAPWRSALASVRADPQARLRRTR